MPERLAGEVAHSASAKVIEGGEKSWCQRAKWQQCQQMKRLVVGRSQVNCGYIFLDLP